MGSQFNKRNNAEPKFAVSYMGLEDTSKQGTPPAIYNMVYLRLHHPHNLYFYTRQTSGYPTTRQTNLVGIRHPQKQLQIHVLRGR